MKFSDYIGNNINIIAEAHMCFGDVKKQLAIIHKDLINIHNILVAWSKSLAEDTITSDNYKAVADDILNTLENILNQYVHIKKSDDKDKVKQSKYKLLLKELIFCDSIKKEYDELKTKIFDIKVRNNIDKYINNLWTRTRNRYDFINDTLTNKSDLEYIINLVKGSIK